MENPYEKISTDLSEIKELITNLYKQPIEPSPEDDIIGIKGAEKILKKKAGTIYNLVSLRKIPHFKRGQKLYFSKKSLINHIKEGKVSTFKDLENDVNNTLAQQKKKKGYTQAERVKKFTSSLDIDNLTPEEGAKEATDTHFDVYHNAIKNNK
jgi:hypothetical protein